MSHHLLGILILYLSTFPVTTFGRRLAEIEDSGHTIYNFRPSHDFRNESKYRLANSDKRNFDRKKESRPKPTKNVQKSEEFEEYEPHHEEEWRPSTTTKRPWSTKSRPYFGLPGNNDPYKNKDGRQDHDEEDDWRSSETTWDSNRVKNRKKQTINRNHRQPEILPLPSLGPPRGAWNDGGSPNSKKVTTLWSLNPHGGYVMTEERIEIDRNPHADLLPLPSWPKEVPERPSPPKRKYEHQHTTTKRPRHSNWRGPGVTPPSYTFTRGGQFEETTQRPRRHRPRPEIESREEEEDSRDRERELKDLNTSTKAWGALGQHQDHLNKGKGQGPRTRPTTFRQLHPHLRSEEEVDF